MSTLYQMVDRVSAQLHGFGGANQEQVGVLLSTITPDVNSFNIGGTSLANGSTMRTGIWEMGTEQVYVTNLTPSGQATSVIRGWNGTIPATHLQNSAIVNNPKFPRARIIEAINDIISSLYPDLSAFKSTEFRTNIGVTYDLPNDALEVIGVQTALPGFNQGWYDNKRWTFNMSGGSLSGTNRQLNVYDNMINRNIKVLYKAQPRQLVLGDQFSASGLDSYVEPVVIYGACWLLSGGIDIRTLMGNSEALQNDRGALNNAGTNVAKYNASVYQAMLQKASSRQAQQYPTRLHRGMQW